MVLDTNLAHSFWTLSVRFNFICSHFSMSEKSFNTTTLLHNLISFSHLSPCIHDA